LDCALRPDYAAGERPLDGSRSEVWHHHRSNESCLAMTWQKCSGPSLQCCRNVDSEFHFSKSQKGKRFNDGESKRRCTYSGDTFLVPWVPFADCGYKHLYTFIHSESSKVLSSGRTNISLVMSHCLGYLNICMTQGKVTWSDNKLHLENRVYELRCHHFVLVNLKEKRKWLSGSNTPKR
jgi:hypothetical protein